MTVFIKARLSNLNMDALKAEVETLVGSEANIWFSAGEVTVGVADETPLSRQQQVQQALQGHDPRQLTPAQQAEVERQQKLEQARRDFKGAELDLTAFNGKDTLLVALARKIAWLEREIAALRGSA